MVELEELCGLHQPPRRSATPSDETLLRVGGVVREFAERAWQLGRPRMVDTLGLEFADLLAPAFLQTDPDADDELRSTLLSDLWTLVEMDLDQARNVFLKYLASTFRGATTDDERRTVEQWFRETLADYPDETDVHSPNAVAGHWMLEYVGDDLSEDEYEDVCRETGQFILMVERKLEVDDLEEALEWARRATEQRVADLCWTFHDRDRLADLVDADVVPNPSFAPVPVDELLDTTTKL